MTGDCKSKHYDDVTLCPAGILLLLDDAAQEEATENNRIQ